MKDLEKMERDIGVTLECHVWLSRQYILGRRFVTKGCTTPLGVFLVIFFVLSAFIFGGHFCVHVKFCNIYPILSQESRENFHVFTLVTGYSFPLAENTKIYSLGPSDSRSVHHF